MKEYKDHSFVNELGNHIDMRVQQTNSEDCKHKTIMITGPKSSWTCRLTEMEYEELRKFL